jgi:SAM-dependent methyltransferase
MSLVSLARNLLIRNRSKAAVSADLLLSTPASAFVISRRRSSGVPRDGSQNAEASATHAFDRGFKRLQRNNAARMQQSWRNASDDAANYDYVREEIASRLIDRLDDIKRDEGFPLALDVGSGPGYVYKAICADEALQGEGGVGGVRKLVQLDSAGEMLYRDADLLVPGSERCDSYRLELDEEAILPFPDGTFDLVISSTSMHWVNQLPKLFKEIRRVLKPDGCFMFAMIGGTTLPELRAASCNGDGRDRARRRSQSARRTICRAFGRGRSFTTCRLCVAHNRRGFHEDRVSQRSRPDGAPATYGGEQCLY